MSDIFVCYSRTDLIVANGVAKQLRAQGWSVFLDVQTRVGKRWHKEIEKELHAASAVVVLWSAKSRDSDFVLEEAEYGKRKGILFPAFIEHVESPYGFGRIQTADLIGWEEADDHPGLAQLLASLRLHLSDGEPPPARSKGAQEPGPAMQENPARATAATKISPGGTFRDKLERGSEGPLMVVIPAGRFLMGSPLNEPGRQESEGPQHEVRIAQPFALGVYVVAFDEYDRYCDTANQQKPEDHGWGREKRPVINVSWEDAQNYCRWLSEQSGRAYLLPSEAQWEYACRAGTDTPFHFGGQITTAQANFDGNYPSNGAAKGEFRKQTLPVGTFAPNAFGLHDMHGNVWEWCQDEWHENYKGAPTDGSPWESGGAILARVVRGGSWYGVSDVARSSARDGMNPDARFDGLGFRVLCSFHIE
jgi:formylglycine-generating enzyme required for sulfatase activity